MSGEGRQMAVSRSAAGMVTDPSLERRKLPVAMVAAGALFVWMYRTSFQDLYINWTLTDSYYSHGFLIAPISLFLVWQKRKKILEAQGGPSPLGYPLLVFASILLILGDFLGFAVFSQLSLVPMLAGMSLLILGSQRTLIMWFPLIFLFMMIPIPASLTQSIVFNLKLLAADAAVFLARLFTLPMVREGSFIHFRDDSLLIGNVCGGLRSLIALLAVGMLMAYYSRTRVGGRLVVLVMAAPIAVIANIARIFLLLIVGYFWGSKLASGRFHDVSGIFIFVVAFILFFSLEAVLVKRIFAQPADDKETSPT